MDPIQPRKDTRMPGPYFNTTALEVWNHSRHAGDTYKSALVSYPVQESMDEDISTSRASLRPWARRAEKQAARARSSSPAGQHRRTSSSRRTPSADLQSAVSLSGRLSGSSAGGSGERSIQSYLARSSRDGDVPELISQA